MGRCPRWIDDQEIMDVIRSLNKFAFIQTTMCCSGHQILEIYYKYARPPFVQFDRRPEPFTDNFVGLLEQIIKKDLKKKQGILFSPKKMMDTNSVGYVHLQGQYKGADLPRERVAPALKQYWDSVRTSIQIVRDHYDANETVFMERMYSYSESR
jgi:hypothetical protein